MVPVKAVLWLYCLLFRRTPFLVTLMLVFFAGQSMHVNASTFDVAWVSIGLIAAAFLSEIIRGGLESVHPDQWQAARALNFSHWQTLAYVILPQAWRVILPPTFAFFVMFIKDTALASQIGVMELTAAGKVLGNKGLSADRARVRPAERHCRRLRRSGGREGAPCRYRDRLSTVQFVP